MHNFNSVLKSIYTSNIIEMHVTYFSIPLTSFGF